jgi:hypothetical protein
MGPWIAVALLIAVIGAGIYFFFGRRPAADHGTPTAAASPSEAPRQPLGGPAESITVPPLDESDPVVRTLVRALSEHPTVTAWLATKGLIRNFAVVVANIADGASPARHLATVRPSGSFRVTHRPDVVVIDPDSYARYEPVADAVRSIDAAGAARLYATLKPRIEEAGQELGLPDSFDVTLERAIVSLLRTPIIEGPIRVQPQGIGYAYVDDRLEALNGAQKHLLRMGPRNVGIIEQKLREFALALGVREQVLPRSTH